MKNIVGFYLLFLLGTSAVQAQVQEENDVAVRNPQAMQKIQNLRIAYISEKLALTPDQAEKFWPVYREFVVQRAALRKELRTFQRTNIDPAHPDPKKEQELVDLGLTVKQKELNLEKEYSGKLLKVINAQQVLALRKAEQDFRTMLINQMPQRKLMQERKEILRDRNQRLKEKVN
jgi:hypothetical protein